MATQHVWISPCPGHDGKGGCANKLALPLAHDADGPKVAPWSSLKDTGWTLAQVQHPGVPAGFAWTTLCPTCSLLAAQQARRQLLAEYLPSDVMQALEDTIDTLTPN